MQGFPAAAIPRRHLAKGHYFAVAARSPFSRLVYPTPVDGGLGVHLTLDLAGQARFGPDVQWLDSAAAGAALDYAVDASRLPAFEAEVRRYWPRLPAGAMTPAYSGIRPKLSGPGEPAADFRIDGPGAHGCAGVVQLFGIESPGLTASLAIADRVAATVARADGPGGRA
jgi:L-2-hydroxyglutarate oxidase LhgO